MIAAPAPVAERYHRHPGDVLRLVLWSVVAIALGAVAVLGPRATAGLRDDVAGSIPEVPAGIGPGVLLAAELVGLALVAAIVVVIVRRRRWRRMGTILLAAALGLTVGSALGGLGHPPAGVAGSTTVIASGGAIAGAVAAASVAGPWLSRRLRRLTLLAVAGLTGAAVLTGAASPLPAGLAVAGGSLVGAAVLVVLGAPNRQLGASEVRRTLRAAGMLVGDVVVVRSTGGRALLCRTVMGGDAVFVKVYGRDTRDADLLYRTYRALLLRHPGGPGPASPTRDVEHQALLLLLAARAGVPCPAMRAVAGVPGGAALLTDVVEGTRLDELAPERLTDGLLDDVWCRAVSLHAAGLIHGALRSANVLVVDDGSGPARAVLVDFGNGAVSTSARARAVDRAELLASTAALVGVERSVASAARVLGADVLGSVLPYLQPLALAEGTRRSVGRAVLRDLRAAVAADADADAAPLERLVRVRPRTILTVAALAGAFYLLLPQLANVDDSLEAMRSADWRWLALTVVMSVGTYAAAAVAMLGGIQERLPFLPTLQLTVASSFVNRVTPANVGGMALSVRFMQRAGIAPARAVTAVGLGVVAGAVVHVALLASAVAWAGRGDAGFSLPASDSLLVVLVVASGLVGLVLATRRGRRLLRNRVLPTLRESWSGVVELGRSPRHLVALVGGSAGVTAAYVAAMTSCVIAFDGGLGVAQIAAVYLGASAVAAAAPTPGGLGAVEAALVAGLTGVGMEPPLAVAAVLTFRLVTFWFPVLPGWICLRRLERRGYV